MKITSREIELAKLAMARRKILRYNHPLSHKYPRHSYEDALEIDGTQPARCIDGYTSGFDKIQMQETLGITPSGNHT